jgi:hypothetical protein
MTVEVGSVNLRISLFPWLANATKLADRATKGGKLQAFSAQIQFNASRPIFDDFFDTENGCIRLEISVV